jgi:hypothetical protein
LFLWHEMGGFQEKEMPHGASLFLEFTDFERDIFTNFVEQTRPDQFPPVDGDDRSSTIGVFQKVVTAFRSDHIKTESAQDFDEFAA